MTRTIKPKSVSRTDSFLGMSAYIMTTVFLGRFIIDIGTRMIFPFIPQIAAGLGISIVAFSGLIFVRTIAGMASPVFGMLSDKYGRRKLMVVGLLCQGGGVMGLSAFGRQGAIVSMILFGLGLTALIPAQQAYISDLVAYDRRGRTLAIIEISWAAVGIFILPLVGWLIYLFDWRVPFVALGFLSIMGAMIVWLRLPPVEQRMPTTLSWPQVRAILLKRNVIASIVVAFLVFVAVGAFPALWSIWLTADFALTTTALGLVATGIGIAEAGGTVTSSLFIDRMGKRLGSGLGLLLSAIVFLLLPLSQGNFPLALIGLVTGGLLFEFTIVSMIPIYSEQVPHARATVLSLVMLGVAIGAAFGTPLAAILWEQYGLWAICMVVAGCLSVACGILWKFLSEIQN